MRWKRKVPPKPGDRRTVQKFAFWPFHCDEGHFHWLEVLSLEEYVDPWGDWTPCKYHRHVFEQPIYTCPDKERINEK